MKKVREALSIFVLIYVLALAFARGLKEVLFNEIKDPTYLNQKDFDTCSERARAIIEAALKSVLRILSYAICMHREKYHCEDCSEEKSVLAVDMTEKEIKVASRGWWRG